MCVISPTAPDAPDNFIVTVIDSESVRATWDDPPDPNGIILSFSLTVQLYLCPYLPQPQITSFTLNPNTFEYIIAGLHPIAAYIFFLSANTSFGEGSRTDVFATTNEAGNTLYVQFLYFLLIPYT